MPQVLVLLDKKSFNVTIIGEILSFSKALLFSGNELVQKGMDFVTDTREEALFVIMKKIMDRTVTRFKEWYDVAKHDHT